MSFTKLGDRAALVQRDMRNSVQSFRPQRARTLATFEEGTRKETGRLAGLQIPYWVEFANGQTWYNPVAGDTSFKGGLRERSRAMYAGVVFRNMNMPLEDHIMKDMERGFIPDSYIKERRRRIATHMMKKNWAAIADGSGVVAVAASAAGSTLTCTQDNNARNRSKGSFRLQISASDEPLYYEAYNTTTHALVAKFFVTGKPSATTATVDFTGGSGNIAALNAAGLYIVEADSYRKEIIGIGGHIGTTGLYQGADRAADPFLANPEIDQGDSAITPTAINTAKQVLMTRANNAGAADKMVCHLTFTNYFTLANFGYTSRTYNADNGKAGKTFGLPMVYEDEDTVFVPDADYEEGYIDLREKSPYFEYVQKEFGLKKTDGIGRQEWVGSYQRGSTESYENYNEACNIVWDGRGKDGKGENEGGSPNSAVAIKNITINTTINQAAVGV